MSTPVLLYTEPHDASPDWDRTTRHVATFTDDVAALSGPTVGAATQSSVNAPLWQRYSPTFIASFQWTKRPAAPLHTAGLIPHLRSIQSNLITPGSLPLYSTPALPLRLSGNETAEVPLSTVQPPLLATLMAIEKADPTLLSPLPTLSPPPLTFVSFRHSIKNFLVKDNGPWRVDIQQVGAVVYLRCYQDFSVQYNALGRQFESACAEGQKEGEEGGHMDFLSIVRGAVGSFQLITTSEIDLCSSRGAEDKEADTPLSSYVELKTARVGSLHQLFKLRTNYWQSFIGGVPRIVYGQYSPQQPQVITRVDVINTADLVEEGEKQRMFSRLHSLLSFIAAHIQPGAVYALVQQRTSVHSPMEVALYEVENGIQHFPIVTAEMLSAMKEVVASPSTAPSVSAARMGEGSAQLLPSDHLREAVFRFPFARYETQRLRCRDCGGAFDFTSTDQSFHAEKGFPPPVRCRQCRDRRKR